MDVSQSEQVEPMGAAVVTRFGRLDSAFNNAGIETEHLPLAPADEASFNRVMRVNGKGAWLRMKHECQHLMFSA